MPYHSLSKNQLPFPAGHPPSEGVQDTFGPLGCKRTLLAHVQLFIHQDHLLHRAALKELFSLSVYVFGIALTQVQHLPLGLVEPH